MPEFISIPQAHDYWVEMNPEKAFDDSSVQEITELYFGSNTPQNPTALEKFKQDVRQYHQKALAELETIQEELETWLDNNPETPFDSAASAAIAQRLIHPRLADASSELNRIQAHLRAAYRKHPSQGYTETTGRVSFYYYFKLQNEKRPLTRHQVKHLIPPDIIIHAGHPQNKILHIADKSDAARFAKLLATFYNKAIQVQLSGSNYSTLVYPSTPPKHHGFDGFSSRHTEYQTEDLNEFLFFAANANMLPTNFDKWLDAHCSVSEILQLLSRINEDRLWLSPERNAFNACQAAHDAGFRYLIVRYVGTPDPTESQIRKISELEAFGLRQKKQN